MYITVIIALYPRFRSCCYSRAACSDRTYTLDNKSRVLLSRCSGSEARIRGYHSAIHRG